MPDLPRRCIRVYRSRFLMGWRANCLCLWARTYPTHRIALHAAVQHLAYAQRTSR